MSDRTCTVRTSRDRHCGVPIGDDREVCRTCEHDLEKHLAELPSTWRDLQRTLARVGNSANPGSRNSETAMPYDVKAAEAEAGIRVVLVGWIRALEDDPDRHPVDTVPSMSRWLLGRLQALLGHVAAPDICTEIREAVHRAERATHLPAQWRFVGRCDHDSCTADLYAKPDRDTAHCRECDTAHDVQTKLDDLRARLQDRLVTATEFAGYARILGVEGTEDQIARRVRVWAHRRIVVAHTGDGDTARYRYAELEQRLDYGRTA